MSLMTLFLWGQMWVKIGDYSPGAEIGIEHTCDGGDIPPLIQWGNSPKETQVYVLRLYDPDAPADTFIHWIAYNIKNSQIGRGSRDVQEGYNDFGKVGYGGPCPPVRDSPHRYVAEVYALKKPLPLNGAVSWEKIRSLMGDKVIGHAQTFVTYKRHKR
ncbi:MAG: YbhB/YbcL family Raf kinase inhibitor-like protein [Bacteroidia bacterium]|nr:YbhB/YbcL family Raf kinase inhibitor-like protein [Bacteroidia bacterium]MDW8015837.1 YbhB/YbcL family Raf kinase inhibitor-like protein [Bacteroidia bacterium]